MFYKFSGADSSSDDGHFVVIIEAENKRKALSLFEDHLFESGKLDCFFSCERVMGPILYSNLEANNGI